MDSHHLQEMELRIRQLETELQQLRKNRSHRWKVSFVGLMAAVIGVATTHWLSKPAATAKAADAPIVQIKSVLEAPFEIQGKNKKTIVRVEEDPVPALWLVGNGGKSVKLVITDNGGGISVRAAANAAPTMMGFDGNGSGLIICADKDGKRQADLSADGAQVYSDGRVVGRLGTSGKGDGVLLIGNTNGDTVVDAGVLDGRGIVRAYPYSPRTGEILRGSNFIVGAKK